MPVSIGYPQSVLNITLQMAVPDGNLMQTALYADDGAGQPGELLGTSDVIPVSASGPFTMDIGGSGLTLSPGTVWLAFVGLGGSGSYVLSASNEQESDFQFLDGGSFPPSVGAQATDEGEGFGALAVDINVCYLTPTVTETNASTPTASETPASSMSFSPSISNSPTPLVTPTAPTALPAFVTSSVLGSGCAGNGAATSFVFALPSGPAELLLTQVESTGPVVTGVTWGGIPLAQLGGSPMAISGGDIYTYYLVNPAPGSHTLNFTPPWGCSWNVVATVYENINTSNPIGAVTSNSGNSSTFVDSITTTSPYSIIDDFIAYLSGPFNFSALSAIQLFAPGDSGCCDAAYGSYYSTSAPGTYNLDYNETVGPVQWWGESIELRAWPMTPSPTPVSTPTLTPVSGSTPMALSYSEEHSGVSGFKTVTPDLLHGKTMLVAPNPARGKALVLYGLVQNGNVRLELFGVSGLRNGSFNLGRQNAGQNSYWLDLSAVASGVYFAVLEVDEGSGFHQAALSKIAVVH